MSVYSEMLDLKLSQPPLAVNFFEPKKQTKTNSWTEQSSRGRFLIILKYISEHKANSLFVN